jgi:threonylcarbamoyladenosine tRNA methylthiotransferase MtaB
MSLQSGSEKILKLMNRNYSPEYYIDTVNKIKSKYPLFNFTTDLIVGFPQETDSDFNDSLALMKEAGFSQTHIFRYSQRPMTKAATLKGQITEIIKKERAQKAAELNLTLKKEYYKKFNSIQSEMLTEGGSKNYTEGFNNYYVPIRVNQKISRNTLIKVITYYNDGEHLEGVMLK